MNIPKRGYVGVVIVTETTVPVKNSSVEVDGKVRPIQKAPLAAKEMSNNVDDLELCSYLVRVDWIKAVAREDAYWEKGLFAIQHTT